jgi:hypothetical protein
MVVAAEHRCYRAATLLGVGPAVICRRSPAAGMLGKRSLGRPSRLARVAAGGYAPTFCLSISPSFASYRTRRRPTATIS